MAKKQAKEVFDKYNPQNAVIRCPNGRAPVRKMLDTYAKAAVNLYGIIPIKELAEIFNSQNSEQTNADEIFTLLLPGVLRANKTSLGGYYCFYKDCIISYSAKKNFDFGDFLLLNQKDKQRYIPVKKEFLNYCDIYYEDEIQQQHWRKVFNFLTEELKDYKMGKLFDFYEDIKDYSQVTGEIDLEKFLQGYDLIFNDKKQIQRFFDLYTNAHNNTRMWINKGYTPNELMELRKKENQKNGQDKIVIREHIKVGPNEPCPCGSGKKYKKCCRLIQEARTAQLHWSDVLLFYETWYGLLGFINEKKKIIPVQIKPIYPNDLSDDILYKVREELWKNPEIITEYLASTNLPIGKAELLKSWRKHHIKGMFFIIEYKSEYAVAIGSDKSNKERLYGIKGISRSLAEALQSDLPVQIETVLLPFKDKIIYDSYLTSMNISYGKNIKEMFLDTYKKAGEKGIITSLPAV